MQLAVSSPKTIPQFEWVSSFEAWIDRCLTMSESYRDVEVNQETEASVESRDIQAARNGDHDAFRRLVERYQTTIGTQMRRFSRDQRVLEELVHDVFVEAFVSLRSFRGKSPFQHWLRKIAVRVGYRHWKMEARDKRRADEMREKADLIANFIAPPTDAIEAMDQLHSVFSKLSPRDRLVLTLLYWDGQSVAEAAKLAGWTQSLVKVQAHRARKRLKKLLEQSDERIDE